MEIHHNSVESLGTIDTTITSAVISVVNGAFHCQPEWLSIHAKIKSKFDAGAVTKIHHAKTISVFAAISLLHDTYDIPLHYIWRVLTIHCCIQLSDLVDISTFEEFNASLLSIRKYYE